jgi:uncharacterized protein YkwD
MLDILAFRILTIAVVLIPVAADDPKPKPADAADATPKLDVTTELPELIAAHNAERKKKDLPPLEPEPRLAAAARRQALDMAEHEKMAHEGTDGSTPADRVKDAGYKGLRSGENVAYGYRDIPALMEGWMNSPHHRDNILGEFTQIGVARARSEKGEPYWAAVFGTPWPEPDADVARSQLLEALNARRKEAGAPELARVDRLDSAAQRHAEDNAKADGFQAKDSDGVAPLDRVVKSGFPFRQIGQTDGSGQVDAAKVLDSWLGNESNRKNLLDPKMTKAGIGYARTAEAIPYWSLILAQPRK